MQLDDLTKEVKGATEGVWLTYYAANGEDCDFLLTYSNSPKPRNFMTKELARARVRSRNRVLPTDVMQEITLQMLVQHVVKGWRRINNGSGEPLAFDPKLLEAELRKDTPGAVDLRDWLAAESSDIENFGGDADDEVKADREGAASEAIKSSAKVAAGVG